MPIAAVQATSGPPPHLRVGSRTVIRELTREEATLALQVAGFHPVEVPCPGSDKLHSVELTVVCLKCLGPPPGWKPGGDDETEDFAGPHMPATPAHGTARDGEEAGAVRRGPMMPMLPEVLHVCGVRWRSRRRWSRVSLVSLCVRIPTKVTAFGPAENRG